MTNAYPPSAAARPLPRSRAGSTRSVRVGGSKAYLTSSIGSDGSISEVMLRLGKQGSTLAGFTDAVSILLSLALEYGVPLDMINERLTGLHFEPSGHTDDPELPTATSIVDYLVRRLTLDREAYEMSR